MADLITTAQAKVYLGIASSDTTQDAKLAAMITAASRAIEKYCDVDSFDSQVRTEYHSGKGNSYLYLRSAPITAVSRVGTAPTTVLTITNTATTNQIARVSYDGTNLTLNRTAGGTVAAAQTLSVATYTTISTLAAAVTALGNGWTGTVDATYAGWPSSELRSIQGAMDASHNGTGAELELYVRELTDYRINATTGTLYGYFPLGLYNVRVDYTGGYSTIPEDLQQAACAYVAALFRISSVDRTLQSEKIGDYSYTTATHILSGTVDLSSLSPDAAMYLAPYRRPHAL